MKRNIFLLFLLQFSFMLHAQYPYRSKPKVYIECNVQEFGKLDKAFGVQLANALREKGWIIQSSADKAEYILTVEAEAREYTKQVTKAETTYTYHKRRDTVLIVDATSSANSADAMSANMGELEMGNNAMNSQYAKMHKTVVRDTVIAEAHTNPIAFMYFTYMDAHVTLSDKEEVLFEDFWEIKEGHTLSYEEAAHVASKRTIEKISNIVPPKIKRK